MISSIYPSIADLGFFNKILYTTSREDYGLQRASSRTHKQYLRKHHLGKFRKKQAK